MGISQKLKRKSIWRTPRLRWTASFYLILPSDTFPQVTPVPGGTDSRLPSSGQGFLPLPSLTHRTHTALGSCELRTAQLSRCARRFSCAKPE